MNNQEKFVPLNGADGADANDIDVQAFLAMQAEDPAWESILSVPFDPTAGDDGLAEDDYVYTDDYNDLMTRPIGDEETVLAALSNVDRLNRKRSSKQERQMRALSEEDFIDPSEKIAFRIVKANVDAMFDKKPKAEQFLEAARWVFSHNLEPFSFEECCRTLTVRKDVLRLRIQYELWRRWLVLPFEWPFLVVRVPEILEGEIYMIADEEGYDLARTAWLQPGIETGKLLDEASGGNVTDKYIQSLERLADRYILSPQGNNWWLTGRNHTLRDLDISNPALRRSYGQLTWSKMF